ncbi:MAG: hypothetical protein ACKE51_04760 [Methylococcaceae bacterium]
MLNKRLNQAEFAKLIPHAGNMILIDQVEDWGDSYIVCSTLSHQSINNPLRLNGSLSSIHLIEYGAQSMAIHGGLLTGKASPGFLAAARAVHFNIDCLDQVQSQITITARAELKIENGAVYKFHITDEMNTLLVDARATVINI